MEPSQVKPGQNHETSMFERKPLEIINSTSFPKCERLERELEEAKNNAEVWAKAFDECYEDLCTLKDQIEMLKSENSTLLDELMWLRAKLLGRLETTEESSGEDFGETPEGEEPLLQSECEDSA